MPFLCIKCQQKLEMIGLKKITFLLSKSLKFQLLKCVCMLEALTIYVLRSHNLPPSNKQVKQVYNDQPLGTLALGKIGGGYGSLVFVVS